MSHHFGGYAKRRPELDAFIADFAGRHGTKLDWVYEAKMLYGIFDHLRTENTFPPPTTIVAVIAGRVRA